MALDRFVRFHNVARPSREEVGKVLEDYLGGSAISVEWDKQGKRFIAQLHGVGSNPFKRLVEKTSPEAEERWLEVSLGSDNIDVITRRQDELTNAVAHGFAALVARFWSGTYEEPG
jgi:hypothetical protein